MVSTAKRPSTSKPAGTGPDEYPNRDGRVAHGKDARVLTPLTTHAEFDPPRSRDPVSLLLGQASDRVPELVPVRHGRMLVSPFTFFRGAALPMVADLASTPASGLRVQLCGDAHLSNFGAFASPDRRLVFDLNDFDETLPGPFEWDVKRLAASFAVAGRANGIGGKRRRAIVVAVGKAYRTAMRRFAAQPMMDVWYARLEVEAALANYRKQVRTKRLRKLEPMLAKARGHDSMQALAKLTTTVDGKPRFISDPPTVVPAEEVFAGVEAERIYEFMHTVMTTYRRSLQSDRRHLVSEFRISRVARKVVGVGSVGTQAWIILMTGDDGSALLLQGKEAQPSVLAGYCGSSQYRNQGERVVAGQHLMQAASDIFLGWTHVTSPIDGRKRDYYVRQLRDWKFSAPIEQMRPSGLKLYAELCGWTLARAHARSGDRIAIGAYLGGSDRFDQAIADFAEAYADQNERDYQAFQEAVRLGQVEAISGV